MSQEYQNSDCLLEYFTIFNFTILFLVTENCFFFADKT